MLGVKHTFVISQVPLVNCRKVVGKEAIEVLRDQFNISFIHVDDDGKIFGMNKQNEPLNGSFLYEKRSLEHMPT